MSLPLVVVVFIRVVAPHLSGSAAERWRLRPPPHPVQVASQRLQAPRKHNEGVNRECLLCSKQLEVSFQTFPRKRVPRKQIRAPCKQPREVRLVLGAAHFGPSGRRVSDVQFGRTTESVLV